MIQKLFIIDDEPIHHRLVELVIKYSDTAIETRSFIQAADAFSFLVDEDNVDSLPDLILLDLHMAIISGWDFLELFETFNSRFNKTVDIIILTSSIDPYDKAKALNYKCVKGYFSKPFTKEILEYITNSPTIGVNKDEAHD
ncbi:MAG: response regulator [Sphingobacteriaceae bacterium]